MKSLPIAIVGGGPVGLAALAHLLERGQEALLLESGATVAANVIDWGHVRLFSPWEFNIDSACARLLQAASWQPPPAADLPTGKDLYEQYLRPLAQLPALQARIRCETRVLAISRRQSKIQATGRASAPFQLQILDRAGESLLEARAVIDASGTWHNPNPLGANGLPALGERALRQRIRYGIPDVLGRECQRYAGKRVLVAGSGHSAINTLLDLLDLQAQQGTGELTWVMRGGDLRQVYGGGEQDALPARGALGMRIKAAVDAGNLRILAPFRIEALTETGDSLRLSGQLNGTTQALHADEIIACTGARPDLALLSELRLELDPAVESPRALAPLIDPNLHSCGTVPPHGEAELRQPERDFYIVGMKSYGRAPTFLMATGYEQVRSIAAALAGDWAAARNTQLELPETGVCLTDYADDGCCAPAPQPLLHPAHIPAI